MAISAVLGVPLAWLLARTDDPTERLALLNHRMNSITGTFLRQVFFHEFEAEAHAIANDMRQIIHADTVLIAEDAAGKVIGAFGDFVVGGNYLVGLIVAFSVAGLLTLARPREASRAALVLMAVVWAAGAGLQSVTCCAASTCAAHRNGWFST